MMLKEEIDMTIIEMGKKTNHFTDEQLRDVMHAFDKEKVKLAFQKEFALLNLVFDFNVPFELMEIVQDLYEKKEFNRGHKNDYFTICQVKGLYESFKTRFGRLPKIFPYLVSMAQELNNELVVEKFNVRSMKFALNLEEDLPSHYHRIAYSLLFGQKIYDVVCKLKKHNRSLKNFIAGMPCKYPLADPELEKWIVSHIGSTKNEIIHEIITFWNDKNFPKNSSLYIQQNYFKLQRKEREWARCENKYPKAFRLPFECHIKDNRIEVAQEQAYILDPNDKKQVILGHLSVCCQKLGSSAEPSMMEGLLNPYSGFLVFERSSKLLAQSWVWLTEDHSTLVLDNIELADQRKPEDIIVLLKRWVIESPYAYIQMGVGFNDVSIGEAVNEEVKWYKQYWKYQYTDAIDRVWLKKDNTVLI
ncbi:hypothetical protein [Priestia megaterium]|uniref:hypothetical protein n=1 Tax=Priestia megaterium TaxID=1404 RepID=UPI0011460619|nr:hypothetical protein [Priestia megaterium]